MSRLIRHAHYATRVAPFELSTVADIVEVSPPLDPGGSTALVACSLMFELLCIMVDGRR